jgi:hypothetical protein
MGWFSVKSLQSHGIEQLLPRIQISAVKGFGKLNAN